MKYLYVVYDTKFPYLPIAVGDTLGETGRMVGKTDNAIQKALKRGSETVKKVEVDWSEE